MGIEPTLIAWKAIVLPLNYTCKKMVLEKGLEPLRHCCHRILSPVRLPFRHSSNHGFLKMVSHKGIEPLTPSLKVKCSTAELMGHRKMIVNHFLKFYFNWLGWLGSNQRMIESKSIALPLGYSPIMVGSDGFEPPKHEVTDLQSAAFGHFANYPICSFFYQQT